MWHTGSSLVLNKQEAEFSFLDHNIVVGNYNETPGVIVWKSQNEAEFIAKVEGHHGGSRYVICPLNDQKTTVLYDAKEDNYYRYVASQRDTQYQYVEAIFKNPQNFAPNSLVQRLNRAWDKTFSIPRGPILKSHDRFVHHYLGVPKGGDPWYNKAGYVLGGFIISPVKNFLKLPLEMLPRGMECALEHAIDAVDAKQWPGIVKALIETPLYLGLAAVKTSRLIMRSILSPLETLKEAGAALKRVCHSACESKPNVSGVTSNGLFGGRFCEIGKVLGFMSPQAQM
jgi:hypothetical protein